MASGLTGWGFGSDFSAVKREPDLIRSRYSSTEMRLSAAAAIQAIATASAEHNTLFMQFPPF